MSHLASILILILKIVATKSVAGISFKTQLLYLLVFVTRYLDLFSSYVSLYNSVMKVFFIASAGWIVYAMAFRYKATWDSAKDSFRFEILLAGATILALIFKYEFTMLEVSWAFSVYLEAVAILPQLYMLQTTGEAESITAHYLFALGSYRALYLANWVWRYYTESYVDWIAWVAGAVQTALYSDFAYIYITK
ncbi:ER lumen protein retaining receptor [Gonapodya prolifera JEL478]|uniref:ER lumen protein-retaining receptor n=1 Tax=Gonapodya prolifera (strain JEL478) TaxID=1344416 RepID=A0A139AT23_GONPJ|nr:ER lumen protein retaining receptor [Gonapodya prolifera JEL478]|eukprot:KXS19880.1 ER lumen protein retaining receptor [Gonapodya prolifera JEL478]